MNTVWFIILSVCVFMFVISSVSASPVINLTNPANGTIFNVNVSIDFECNWTVEAPDNISLFVNDTLNYTEVGGSNLSVGVVFDSVGIYNWDCYGCLNHICNWSTNGNWSVVVVPGALDHFPVLYDTMIFKNKKQSFFEKWMFWLW